MPPSLKSGGATGLPAPPAPPPPPPPGSAAYVCGLGGCGSMGVLMRFDMEITGCVVQVGMLGWRWGCVWGCGRVQVSELGTSGIDAINTPGGTQLFSGIGVCRPDCQSIGYVNWGVLWTEIFKFGGLRSKICAKIEAGEWLKFSNLSQKGVLWTEFIALLLSKCKKSEKTSECQFTRKRVKATQKKLLSTRKREKREKKVRFFTRKRVKKEWKWTRVNTTQKCIVLRLNL